MSSVVVKAIKLIDLVANEICSLSEISAASGMSRSTTHRILSTLVAQKYLALEAKRYALGYRLLELGEQKKRSLSGVEAFHEVLVRYAKLTSDTVHLAVLDGKDMLIIDRVPGARQLRLDSFIGQRAPACRTAVGKALIGRNDPKTWPKYFQNLSKDSNKSPADLTKEFQKARLRNYAFDLNEVAVGTCGVAASFYSATDRRFLACSINGASVYFEGGRLEELASTVQAMAGELEQVSLLISAEN